MTGRIVERLAWGVALVLALVTIVHERDATSGRAAPAAALSATSPPPLVPPPADASVLALTIERIVAQDPFRIERRPADVPFTLDEPAAAGVATSVPPRPALALLGIVGPPWQAVVSGIPGREAAALVEPGQTLSSLTIVRITAESITIRGQDTTWTLSMSRPWR